MKDFEFIIRIQPDQGCLREMHKTMAQGLINKYGAEVMKRVIESMALKK